jgi:hypothetical protein
MTKHIRQSQRFNAAVMQNSAGNQQLQYTAEGYAIIMIKM